MRSEKPIARSQKSRLARLVRCSVVILASGSWLLASSSRADWLMGRANVARTGTQELHAPQIKTPKVRWAFKQQEHFIAAPVPGEKLLLAAALGPYNSAEFHAIAIDDFVSEGNVKVRPGVPVWNKSSPNIHLPVVSSPAIYGGMAIFGDGMHQTDGASLYSYDLQTGRALWRYDVDGKLIHMEGAPVVDPTFPGGTAVFIGAGDGGVLAVAANRVMVDGKETDITNLKKVVDQKWSELMKAYEAQKRKDPDFATPPGDDALPRATPVKLWQKGQKEWHVDAPLLMTQDRIIVCSAYVDADKVGKRAVICLDRKSGETLWERELDLNPWAGASVDGDVIVVGCSSVRMDKNLLADARGMVCGLDIRTGRLTWRRPYRGGVLGTPAIVDGMAIFALTDGTVHALEITRGRETWVYTPTQNKEPFFAGVCIAGNTSNRGVVYAADLGGVLHAISVIDGKPIWTINVGKDPGVQAPGMVFAAPVVKGQEIFLATCNVQGEHADQPCAIVAVADKDYQPGVDLRPKVLVDKPNRRIEIPALVAPRKLASLKDIYPLEVVCTWPTPAGQKAHETVVTTEVKPSEVQAALESLGLKPGTPSHGAEDPVGPELKISLLIKSPSGRDRIVPIEKTIIDKTTGKSLPELSWRFTGSTRRQLDPDNPATAYGADLSGTFVTIYPVSDETVIQGNLNMSDQSLLKLEMNRNILPEENTPVKLLIEVK